MFSVLFHCFQTPERERERHPIHLGSGVSPTTFQSFEPSDFVPHPTRRFQRRKHGCLAFFRPWRRFRPGGGSPRNGARVGFLTKEGLLSALKELGLAAIGNAEEAGAVRTRRATVGAELSEEHGKLSEQLEIVGEPLNTM